MASLVNKLLCRLGIHSAYFVETVYGEVVEHCHFCPRVTVLYHRRRF